MRLVSGPDVATLLRRMSGEQCWHVLRSLSEGYAKVSYQAKLPESKRTIAQPLRTVINHKNGDQDLFMPSSDGVTTAIKILSRPQRSGDPYGVVQIAESGGRTLGLLNAVDLTSFRTALASMTIFARSSTPKQRISVFGAGNVAAWHARLALLLYPKEVEHFTFISRGRKGLERLAYETLPPLQETSPSIEVATLAQEGESDYSHKLRETVSASDALFCCTPATQPLFPYSYLQGDANRSRFISLVGSSQPHMQEVDADTLLSGDGVVYVDSEEACLAEAGELILAKVPRNKLREVGDVVLSDTDAINPPAGRNIVFKSVGVGFADLVVGKALLELAIEQNLGTEVDGF